MTANSNQQSAVSFLAGAGALRLVADSRCIHSGDAFAAYPGDEADGRRFIVQAIAAGASCILWERDGFEWDAAWNIPNLGIAGLRKEIGAIASEVNGEPSRRLWMIGVTGTNGKTSCSHWLATCLADLGRKTALVGTLGNGFPGALSPTANTTPDAVTVHSVLKEYEAQGATAVAMEVSSHGLDQGRVNGVHFDVALLTNLSRDHLDYHGDMASYAAAKATLFDWPGLQYAVLNLDDPFGVELAGKLGCSGVKVVGYGFHGEAQGCQIVVKGRDLQMGADGLRFEAATPWGKANIASAMLGRFNASNLLGVLATLLVSGAALEQAVAALGRIKPVPGRLQQFGGGDKPLVVVDYAHTPDALEKVLQALREIVGTNGSLSCVFGCGGNRDKGKRPLMGAVASALADRAIVTSDNPRHEDPRTIIDEIVAGMGSNFHVEEDRAAAIDQAIRQAKCGDIVLIAGKGHEDYQDINNVKLPFSDAEVAQRVLQEYRPC
ncbi:UDP-N-acetylmuramoyl-L-alanyl-D-glutamate--2,6-diaminopimelate ligase [Sulfurimicrobium lacus]|uniref:UDP-N-acetylmuramoyl-L-alanyl-D-glutamate--2,6-diaminopimelate ligase n=1 Tax=Sulfurimicrobium lacus TaxID=2715678 RepID=A0A6F8V9N2_9PROT|nr:UDP-N-acetylmuramoyl-L-alanyl-D-glutamate--2,6-diaminopimelate ligase [Sulfurimicrobium lacus]BCB25475.1 UDP-N-acetylmuramoyl-L-alanyl-D-glutamate--2,6-diaminopimelate ligase [Sulfurimicrobium lacus]